MFEDAIVFLVLKQSYSEGIYCEILELKRFFEEI